MKIWLMTGTWAGWMAHRLPNRAGLPPIRLHDLRHTYATNALRAGTPVKIVSVRLGHTDPAFTLKTYADAIPADDEAAAEKIAAAFE